jgi:hypothetical protein
MRMERAEPDFMSEKDRRGGRLFDMSGAHLPGRAIADKRVLLELRDLVIAEAREVIVVLVVFAHVVDAEMQVLAFAVASGRRLVGARLLATGPLAGLRGGFFLALLLGLLSAGIDPDGIEIF